MSLNDSEAYVNEFISGYLQAIYFANTWVTEEGTEEGAEGSVPIYETDFDGAQFPKEIANELASDCRDFVEANQDLLAQALEQGETAEQAGMDFALSRNGHGAGFFDRGLGAIGKALQEKSRVYGGCQVMIDVTTKGDVSWWVS